MGWMEWSGCVCVWLKICDDYMVHEDKGNVQRWENWIQNSKRSNQLVFLWYLHCFKLVQYGSTLGQSRTKDKATDKHCWEPNFGISQQPCPQNPQYWNITSWNTHQIFSLIKTTPPLWTTWPASLYLIAHCLGFFGSWVKPFFEVHFIDQDPPSSD